MPFGQPSGPPATSRQIRDLIALLESAGYSGFKDARGPFQLNQRQSGGRFTQDEAEALLSRLHAEVDEVDRDRADGVVGPSGPSDPTSPTGPTPNRTQTPDRTGTESAGRSAPTRRQSLARQLEQVPEDLLVAELRRRGWSVDPPPG